MQQASKKIPYNVTLRLKSGKTKQVKIKATSLEVAIRRAQKFHPEAVGVEMGDVNEC